MAHGKRWWAVAALWLALVSAGQTARAQGSVDAPGGEDEMTAQQLPRVRAPELSGGRDWLNTERPLTLAALRGKVVLLDFWTYGCVNCMHVIPDLRRLEAKYANQLVVIGVHSAKFENEKETENIRHIILRYGLEHPVVNDADFRIWQAYAVRAWPTLMLIDPAGYVVGRVEGEGGYEALDRAIAQLVADARRRGQLNEQPLKLALERAKVGDLPLAFPGKLLADARGQRLFIADSNHNRIVVTRLDGTLLEIIGTGERGRRDGASAEATFNRPQGLALDGDALYVADTENHLIRRVDLKAHTVETVAGTGEQLRDYRVRGGEARSTPLSSPWDVQLVGRALYIAMAGPHQIWRLDLKSGEVALFAGTAREAREDGARDEAAFAQPSGLATDGRTLYVADAESNCLRAVELPPSPTDAATVTPAALSTSAVAGVRTLAGGDLFEFGDRDGVGDDVRLQHPLGLAFDQGRIFIADTYNHKIKLLDPATRAVRTYAGTGRPGQADGAKPSFYEPGGLSVAAGKLYVADTNNHAVRVVDLATGETSTLMIRGLTPPAPSTSSSETDASTNAGPPADEVKLAPQRLGAGADAALVVDVALPAGHHLNPAAPQRYRVSVEEGGPHLSVVAEPGQPSAWRDMVTARTTKDLRLPLRLGLRALSPGAAVLRVELTLYYCREDNTGTCRIRRLVRRLPVEVTTDAAAPHELRVRASLE